MEGNEERGPVDDERRRWTEDYKRSNAIEGLGR